MSLKWPSICPPKQHAASGRWTFAAIRLISRLSAWRSVKSATVEREADQWFLTSPEFPDHATAREVKQIAERLIEGPLAVLAAEGDDFSGVELGEFVFERKDGGRNFTLTIEPAVIKVTGTAVGMSRAVAVGEALGSSSLAAAPGTPASSAPDFTRPTRPLVEL